MTRHTSHLGVLALFLISACASMPTATALDIPLTHSDTPGGREEVRPYGSVSPRLLLAPPEGNWTLPELCGTDPLFAILELGDSRRLMIFDRKESGDRFYSRLHFDANGNSDLTDDPVIVADYHEQEQFVFAGFMEVRATIKENAVEEPYCFSVAFQSFAWQEQQRTPLTPDNLSRFMRFEVMVSSFYWGKFALNGTTYRLMLGDTNCNGRFDDVLSLAPPPDSGELTATGDTLYLTRGLFWANGQFTLSPKLVLGGQLFDVAVDIPAKILRLTPNDEPRIPLKLSMETTWLSLTNEKGGVMAYECGKEVLLPPGDYRLVDYATLRKDSQGGWWLLNGTASTDTPTVALKNDAQATLLFGEPFVPWVTVPAWSREQFAKGKFEVQLSLRVEGIGKDIMQNVILVGGAGRAIPVSSAAPSRPKEPVYKVAKPDGEVVSQGKFEYG